MANDPAFLFYPGDYLRDTQLLSEAAQVAYDRIMCEHMRNICISKKQLNFLTKRLNEDELDSLFMVLTEVKEGFQIDWVAQSINKRKAYSESRRNNRKGFDEKDINNISISYESHMENENINEIEIKNKEEFYRKQFQESKTHPENLRNGYFKFIGTIFNSANYKNDFDRPLHEFIKIPDQLSFIQYEELRAAAKKRQVNIYTLLKRMINDPKYTKGKKSIYLLFMDWIEREPIKGTNH